MASKSPREVTPPPGERRTEYPRPEEELRGLPLFASIVAHEIRNPLSSVKIALQTVERHGQIGDKDGTRLRIALREVATIEKVLSDVLDWARPGEHPHESVSVNGLLNDATKGVEPLIASGAIVVALRGTDRDVFVSGDRSRLTKTLAELIQNAADASASGGLIDVGLTTTSRLALITVDDDGRGLTQEALERAFDPFYTTRARGVGLGLPRARAAARKHGGDVTLLARPGGGARAILSLPLQQESGEP